MTIKDKIEEYFNLYIDREGLYLEDTNIGILANSLIENVYSGKDVDLDRIGELDIVFDQMVSNTSGGSDDNNEVANQINIITNRLDELKPDILQFFEVTLANSVIYKLDDGTQYVMSVIENEISITLP